MPEYVIYISLVPNAKFRFGRYTPFDSENLNDTDWAPKSDTLFSSLGTMANLLSPALAETLVLQFQNHEIGISDAFYFLKKEDRLVRFLPKPVFVGRLGAVKDKMLSKVRYVSESALKELSPAGSEKAPVLQSLFLITPSERDLLSNVNVLARKTDIPKVSARKPKADDSYYQITFVETNLHTPSAETGLYFYLNCSEQIKNELTPLFGYWKHFGFGGRKNSNKPVVDIRVEEKIQTVLKEGEMVMTISNYIPEKEEMSALTYYHKELRGGYKLGFDEQRAKVVPCVKSGSICRWQEQKGQIADLSVTEDDPVLRYGRFMAIPLPENIFKHD
ncbi:MAG: hypothetical protein JNL57_00115 [Bacteroidetes bacterium]|nr:hypothetical protein [Bacteroidota bacterium]